MLWGPMGLKRFRPKSLRIKTQENFAALMVLGFRVAWEPQTALRKLIRGPQTHSRGTLDTKQGGT